MTAMGGAQRMALAAAALAVVAVVSGCSGQGNGASSGDADSGTLSVFWLESQAPGLEAVIAEFEKENPDVDVEVTYADGDAYLAAIRTQLQAGTAADVLHVWPGNGNVAATVPLAENGSLMDLSDEPWVDSLPAEIAPYTQYDGKTYSFPSTLSIVGAVYNNAALADSGLEIPETWSEVIQFCGDARDLGTVAFSVGLTADPGARPRPRRAGRGGRDHLRRLRLEGGPRQAGRDGRSGLLQRLGTRCRHVRGIPDHD
jgi:raffinose/stachyose/melibiose transport system substrate-binding protein